MTAIESTENHVPPGQSITRKFPVLTHGSTPQISLNHWTLRFSGLVKGQVLLNWKQFLELPQSTITTDFHCVTQWSRLSNLWEGVLFQDLAKIIIPDSAATFVMIHCYGGYTTNLPLNVLLEKDVILAHKHDDKVLSLAHGWPLRLVVPNRYAWKSAKWIANLEFMNQDQPGFWEQRGYSNNADARKEERFWPELS